MIQKTLILSGKSGAGKDACAQFMKESLEANGLKVLIIHYADPLKWILRDYYKWNGQKDEIGRQLLQQIGTDKIRASRPDYWAEVVGYFIQAITPYDDFDVAIIPDARFPNEIKVVENIIGPTTVVRIHRQVDGKEWTNELLTAEQLKHPSETSLDYYTFDYIIENDSDLQTFKDSATTVLIDLGIIEGEIEYV